MANDLDQDPLYFDTPVSDIPCARIRAVKFTGGAAATASIIDSDTDHILWATLGPAFDEINVTIPRGADGTDPRIDVALSAGAVLIYLGSGPR